MNIFKPTVLDAARISREIARLQNRKITGIFRNRSRTTVYLKLADPLLILKYVVENKFAYIGIIESIPSDAQRILPGLPGFVLTGAEQMNFDRIISIHLQKEDRLGRRKSARIVLQIIPNIGNMYLTDDRGAVKGMLRRKDIKFYAPPAPLKKATILNFDNDQLISIVERGADFTRGLYGLNERDIFNLSLDLPNDSGRATETLRDYVNRAIRPGPSWIIRSADAIVGYSLVKPHLKADETAERHDSALSMYEAYYMEAVGADEESERLQSLQKTLSAEIDRQKKKMAAIEKELKSAEGAARFKLSGELILANINKIEKGAKKARLKNLESPSPEYVEINLDPSKSPATSADDYFKKYRKAVASQRALKRRLIETGRKLAALEIIKTGFYEDADNLQEELQKLIPARAKQSLKKQIPKRKPYRTFRASCGWEVLIGKSNKDNDELTLKIASKDDYWFHAWQAAGSHTVLRLPSKNSIPDKQALLEAASLAACFSKARKSSKVPVIYTQVKYVRKPRKFPPGKVVVEREKQLMVRPADPDDFATHESPD
jgi:predicted ribosome quality control (RQC) complex YloA/Tae2 family protein